MQLFRVDDIELEYFDITTTDVLINGYAFNNLTDEWHKTYLRGMQTAYESAVNAANNARDELELETKNETFKKLTNEIIEEFLPEMLFGMVLEMAETLVAFEDDEADIQ